MKRILAVFLCVVILVMPLVSCGQATNDDLKVKEDSKVEEHIHSFSPATCAAPKTCTNCGYTEGDKLTRHTPAGDICSVCNLDFYEELVNLIKANDNGNDAKYPQFVVPGDKGVEYIIKLDGHEIDIWRKHREENSDASIGTNHSINISRGAMVTQSYEWWYNQYIIVGLSSSNRSAHGEVNPLDMNFKCTQNSGCDSAYAIATMSLNMEEVITKAFIPLLEKSDKNLRPADFGFVNYG